MVLVSLEDTLNLVVSQQKAVMGQLFLGVLTVVGFAHSVIVTVIEVRHKGRWVFFGYHLVPIDIQKPWVGH